MSLDFPHALGCPVWRGADPDECSCDTDGPVARSSTRTATRPVTQADHRRMHLLWRKAGVGGTQHREQRLALTSAAIGRDIASSKELTGGEVRLMLRYLQDLDGAGVLAEKAAEYLERRAAG